MIEFQAENQNILILGRCGENGVRKIIFDIADWISAFGTGTVQLLAQRKNDEQPYPCVIQQADNTVIWTVSAADLAQPGYGGRCELIYLVGEQVVKSRIWPTLVQEALGAPCEKLPEPWQNWVDQIFKIAESAETATPVSVDMTNFASSGTIVETYADGSTVTHTMEFDADGTPVKVSDTNGNVTELIGFASMGVTTTYDVAEEASF